MDSSDCYTTCEDSLMPVSSSTVDEGACGGEEAEATTHHLSSEARTKYELLQLAYNGAKKQLRKLNEQILALQEQLEKSANANTLLQNENMQLKFKEIELTTERRMLQQFMKERKQEMSAFEEKMDNMEQLLKEDRKLKETFEKNVERLLKEDRKWKETYENGDRKWKEQFKQDIKMLTDKITGKAKPNTCGNKQTCVINIEANSSKSKKCYRKK